VDSSHEAQRRVERIAAFRAEVAQLEGEQGLLLTAEQRSRLDQHLQKILTDLRQRFDVDVTESARRISWGVRIASLLGGAAFLAALVLFLHRIWGVLPQPVQIGLLTALPCLFLGATEWLFRRRAAPFYTTLLALAAGLSFVLALDALGTVLNCVASPLSLLAWGTFAVLVAYAYRVRLLLAAGLLLLAGYTAALLAVACGEFWGGFLHRSEFLLPAAVVLYGIPELFRSRNPPEFNIVYRACGAALGLLSLLVLSRSGDLFCASASLREVLCQLAGLLLSTGVVMHGLRLGQSGLVYLGSGAFVIFLFVRLHAWCWGWMPKYLFFLLIGLTAAGLVVVFLRLRRHLAGGGVS
jgi:hypothetical protein